MTIWNGRRLTLRPMRPDEAETYVAYCSHPSTAEWLGSAGVPTIEQTTETIVSMAELGGPAPDRWFRFAIDVGGELAGHVSIHLDDHGGSAEIGYIVRPEFRGTGIAAEAAGLAVDRLIADLGVVRLRASLAPDNHASMRVLESIGMRFEVLARLAYQLDDGWEDDLRYAMTADDRAAWLTRPMGPPSDVELVAIDHSTAHDWRKIDRHYSQRRFVSSVDDSYTDALFPEPYEGVAAVPWVRGILADGERAGFTMLSLSNGSDGGWYLWRFLIDRMHQRRGIGERAITLIVDEARRAGVDRLYASFVDERGGPEPFYERQGFVRTGRLIDGEAEAVLRVS